MTGPDRPTASITEMPERERPLVEEFRIVANQYVDADGAASLLEEMKTATLAQLKSAVIVERGEMPDSRAERLVKSSPEWAAYIKRMVDERSKANKLKLQLEWLRMRERQQDHEAWLQRSERRMGRSAP